LAKATKVTIAKIVGHDENNISLCECKWYGEQGDKRKKF
jgi:uncharacterized protein YodC (DUF2158 family)